MKKVLVFTGVLALVMLTMSFVAAGAPDKAEKGILIGTAIEISSYAMTGLSEESIESMKFRSENGVPGGRIEEDILDRSLLEHREHSQHDDAMVLGSGEVAIPHSLACSRIFERSFGSERLGAR